MKLKSTAIHVVVCAALLLLAQPTPAGEPANPKATAQARAVLNYFHELSAQKEGRRILSGQFSNFGNGANLRIMERIHEQHGHWPALLGVDYADLPRGSVTTKVPNQVALDYWKQGGLLTVMAHMYNPANTNGGGLRDKGVDLADLLKPGTDTHARWMKQLDQMADGLKELRDAGVVVLWRPFHEMNGGWFWWGAKDPEQFIAVWRHMFDYYSKDKALDNLLWVYGPNHGEKTAKYYAGDRYVDLVGLDAYTDFIDPQHIRGYDEVVALPKPFGFTEYGPHGSQNPPGDYDYRRFIEGIEKHFPKTCFFMSWNAKWSLATNQNVKALLEHPSVANREDLLRRLFAEADGRVTTPGDNSGRRAVVKVVQAPTNSLVPDVFMDAQGTLHMVFGLDHHAYYQRSSDNGRTFTAPVRVNSSGRVETKMGERGPKLALGADGIIHVVWMDEWAPGVKTFVRHARSLDGGKSFEPLKTVSTMNGVDGATLAADGHGHVAVFWHVMAEPKPEVNSATWLYSARSENNGETFGANEGVRIVNHPGLACSMCMMRARADSSGNLYLAFRSAAESVRDFYVLKGRITGNDFTAHRVNADNWKIDFCPMCGPELTLAPNGQALCAFMSRNRVYWSIADVGLTDWRLHAGTPAGETDEIYPSALSNQHGEVLMLWQVGPMAVKGTATVKWALYNRDGKSTGEAGVIGKSFAGTKATAFVGTDDDFYIVTTAQGTAGGP